MSQGFLCADIGATNARFARVEFRAQGPEILARQQLSTPGFADPEALVRAALAALPGDYQALALALPGPVVDGYCRITMLPWELSAEALGKSLGIPVMLLNDLEAQGWGIAHLTAGEIEELSPQRSGRAGNRCIIAPGSDLGEAVLYWDGEQHRVFATEGGHCDFAPVTELEYQLAELLYTQYGHARWGDLLSGRGIVSLYRLLADDSHCCLAGEDISEQAVAGNPQARAAVEAFLSILGREAANLALKSMALDGVYIAGGIVPSLPQEWLGTIVPAFDDKPSMRHLLTQMPVRLVRSNRLGLIGAAACLQNWL